MSSAVPPILSVVVPCYNESESLQYLYDRVTKVCAEFGATYEFVMVNDGSKDATWAIMRSLADKDPHVVAVNLTRNHGHQLALSAGLSVAKGQRIFVLDADLQDPPELLPQMMKKMDEGAEIVYGFRKTRYGDGFLKRTACMIFYRFLDRMSETPIPLDAGDFRLMSRRVLDTLNAMPERHRFIRGMVSWTGYKQVPMEYDRDARVAGETKYPLRKLVKLAVDGVTAFSVKPLAFASFAGVMCAGLAVALLAYSLISWLFFKAPPPHGWTSMMAAITILGSVQLFVLGIIGEYLGRLYEQSKGRPLYLIESVYSEGKSEQPKA